MLPAAGGLYAITGLRPAPIDFTAAQYALTLDGGTAGNSLDIVDTASGAGLTVNAGSGSDSITAQVAGTGGFAPLTINGQAGSNGLTVEGSGDNPVLTNNPTAGQTGAGTIRASYPPSGPTRTIALHRHRHLRRRHHDSAWLPRHRAARMPLGQSVTFTATVAAVGGGLGTPAGTVAFVDGLKTLGTEPLVGGVATYSTASLALGGHSITASYIPSDGHISSSSAPLTLVVVPALGGQHARLGLAQPAGTRRSPTSMSRSAPWPARRASPPPP